MSEKGLLPVLEDYSLTYWQDVDQLILLGGRDSKGVRSSEMIMISLQDAEWWTVTPDARQPFAPRSGHGSLLHKNTLYIVGGVCDTNNSEEGAPKTTTGDLRAIDLAAQNKKWQKSAELEVLDRSQYSACKLVEYGEKIFMFSDQGKRLGSPYFVNVASSKRPFGRLACSGRSPTAEYHTINPFRLKSGFAQDIVFLVCWIDTDAEARATTTDSVDEESDGKTKHKTETANPFDTWILDISSQVLKQIVVPSRFFEDNSIWEAFVLNDTLYGLGMSGRKNKWDREVCDKLVSWPIDLDAEADGEDNGSDEEDEDEKMEEHDEEEGEEEGSEADDGNEEGGS